MFRLFRALFNIFRRPQQSPERPKISPGNQSNPQPAPASKPAVPQDPSPDNRTESTVPPWSPNPPMSLETPSSPKPTPTPSPSTPRQSSFANLKQVLNVLRAYTVTFGRPDTPLALRAVVGAIVANLTTVDIKNSELEKFIDDAIAAFDSLGMEASFVDVTAQLLAEQVAVWLKEQETTVTNVVSAYLQQFAPGDTSWESNQILGLVQTVVATLNDGSLSKSGGRSLIDKVLKTFNLDAALSRWVAPEWIALAQRVASYVDKGDLQQELRSVAWAYVQQFQAILSPQLLEQILETGPLNLSPAEVLSGDLNDFSQMLFYKFQLLEADPVVTKSHEAIAGDVHKAIAEFKKNQPPTIDVTKGIQTGDLEISSPFTRNA
ncbi:MAG: hypothetical protein AAFR25_05910 [Cyanobacteria bacterium J06629_19]